MGTRLSILLALHAVGCIQVDVIKSPAFGLSEDLPRAVDPPKVFAAETFYAHAAPAAVEFATVRITVPEGYPPSKLAEVAYHRSRKLEADFALLSHTGQVFAGSSGAYSGGLYGGFGYSRARYLHTATARLFRVLPCSLGVSKNSQGLVSAIANDHAREQGLQEGDQIISVGGAPADGFGTAFALSELAPGDVVQVVWLRPGGGRMAGEVRLVENPVGEDFRRLDNAYDMEKHEQRRARRRTYGKRGVNH